MGNPLFGIDVAGLVNQHIAPGLNPLVLHVLREGTDSDSNDPTGPTTSSFTNRNGRGLLSSYRATEVDGKRIQSGDVRIIIIGDSLPRGIVPQVDSEVTIRGSRYRLKEPIDRDPADATYVCNANPI